MKTQPKYLLEVNNLSKTFLSGSKFLGTHRNINALNEVSFSMSKGESLGIIGESGSGKSTLARVLMGMESFNSGSIRFLGNSLKKWHQRQRRNFLQQVQMVFQDPVSSFNPKRKIGDQLDNALKCLSDLNRDERKSRIHQCLQRTRMENDALNRYPHAFSGGQAQRLAIARALLCKPSMLILDEAVSALDVSVQATILNLLKDLHAELNLSILFIGHDLAVVEYICPRLIVLKSGEIKDDATREEIFSRPRSKYTKSLVSAAYTI